MDIVNSYIDIKDLREIREKVKQEICYVNTYVTNTDRDINEYVIFLKRFRGYMSLDGTRTDDMSETLEITEEELIKIIGEELIVETNSYYEREIDENTAFYVAVYKKNKRQLIFNGKEDCLKAYNKLIDYIMLNDKYNLLLDEEGE